MSNEHEFDVTPEGRRIAKNPEAFARSLVQPSSEHEQRVSDYEQRVASREGIIDQAMAHLHTGTPDDAMIRWILDCAMDAETRPLRAALAESQERERAHERLAAERLAYFHKHVPETRDVESLDNAIRITLARLATLQEQHDALRAECESLRETTGATVEAYMRDEGAAEQALESLRRQIGEWVPVVAGLHDEALRRHEAHAPTGGRCAICACLAASHDVFAAMEREAASGEPTP